MQLINIIILRLDNLNKIEISSLWFSSHSQSSVKKFIKRTEYLYTRYPIVARRAWPAGFRPSASREQRYLAYKQNM